MHTGLPATTKHAEPIARLATGVGTALAAIWFPPAALAQPVIDRLIEKYVRKTERLLIQAVRDRGISALSEPQIEQFVPMAYKFFESARQGEYEHNLKLLSEFISSEIIEEEPEAAKFLQVADALSGMPQNELVVFAWSHKFLDQQPEFINIQYSDGKFGGNLEPLKDIVEPTFLCKYIPSSKDLDITKIEDALFSISNRGLMYPMPAFDMSRPDHTNYRMTQIANDIIYKAKNSIKSHEIVDGLSK